jgi:hypothetical protein
MESDIAAVDGLITQTLIRLQEMTMPKEIIDRVKLAAFFSNGIESEEDIENGVKELRLYLLKSFMEGHKLIID